MEPLPQSRERTHSKVLLCPFNLIPSSPIWPQDNNQSEFFGHYNFSFSRLYKTIHIVYTLCVWFLSPGIIILRFTQVDARIGSLFLFIAEQCSIVWVIPQLLIHSLKNGYLDCFWSLAIANHENRDLNIVTDNCLFSGRRPIRWSFHTPLSTCILWSTTSQRENSQCKKSHVVFST